MAFRVTFNKKIISLPCNDSDIDLHAPWAYRIL